MVRKKKKSNPKKDLVIYSVFSTVMLITSLGYAYLIIIVVKSFVDIPAEEFTSKLVFMGIVLLWLLYKICMFCIKVGEGSVDAATEAYKEIK